MIIWMALCCWPSSDTSETRAVAVAGMVVAVLEEIGLACEVAIVDWLLEDDALELTKARSRSTTPQTFSPCSKIFSLKAHSA